MNDNWEEEGFKLLTRIFGDNFSFEELEHNLKDTLNKELLISFLKDTLKVLGISNKIGEDFKQKIQLDLPPKELLETLSKTTFQFVQKNPEMTKQIEDLGKNFKRNLESVDFHKEILTLPTDNEFEDQIKKRFLEELNAAEQVSKIKVVESFKLALEYVKSLQPPDELFLKSSYHKLGLQPENLKTDTTLNFIENILTIIFTKKQQLLKLSDGDLIDYMNEFINRLGRAIEPYLKIIIVSVYNLQRMRQEKPFDDFSKGFGYYFGPRSSLQIKRSKKEDYIDYRNAIKHDKGFEVFFDRKSEEITIKFYLKRETKGKVYWKKTIELGLKEFEELFRDFRKFQDLFFSFYEVYIKSIDKSYQYRFSSMRAFS